MLAGDTRLSGRSGRSSEELIARADCRAAGAWSAAAWPVSNRWSRRPSCKAALHSETGAAAVDMESHIAAAYAAEAGLPFAALRVISDPAQSRAAGARQRRDQAERRYRPRARCCAASRAIRPTLHALVSTGIDFNRALRSLRGCRGYLIGDRSSIDTRDRSRRRA